MAEISNKLSAKKVASSRLDPTSYADGQNLYLRVSKSGSKSWVFRWHPKGQVSASELGLGSLASRTLEQARTKAGELRAAIANGASKAELKELIKPRVESDLPTFRHYAETVIANKKASPKYRSKKALDQWTATLKAYAFPTIGHKRPGAFYGLPGVGRRASEAKLRMAGAIKVAPEHWADRCR